jgi:YD repeat-containing protein
MWRLSRRRPSRALPASLAALALLWAGAAGAQTAPAGIQYVYDDLGRLSAVVDQLGNVATYAYDAVGNLLAIGAISADRDPRAVVITLVSPDRGRPGASVAVFGKGFGATAGQNAVTFNGVPAAVTSAAPNRLTTTVPPGATTGPILVTAPLGSAASPAPFTVSGALAVSPSRAALGPGDIRQFHASVDGVPAVGVGWAVDGIPGGDSRLGRISADGVYTAPDPAGSDLTVTVTATLLDDRAASAGATVTLVGASPGSAALSVAFSPLPATVDRSLLGQVSVAMAEPPTTFVAAASVSVALEAVLAVALPAGATPAEASGRGKGTGADLFTGQRASAPAPPR